MLCVYLLASLIGDEADGTDSARRRCVPQPSAGIRTWNSLGHLVKKGEKGILILAPIIGQLGSLFGLSKNVSFGVFLPIPQLTSKHVRLNSLQIFQRCSFTGPRDAAVGGCITPFIDDLHRFAW
jgi:hypothetical protein